MRKEAKKRERAEANMRYTKAHRAVRRFQKSITAQLEHAKTQREGTNIRPVPTASLSEEMKEVERECHLIPDAGGEVLTAINFFEEAQDLLKDGFLLPQEADRFIELLEYAEQRRSMAMDIIERYLNDAESTVG